MASGPSTTNPPADTLDIYVIGVPDGPQKIGIAAKPKARLSDLQTGSPVALALVHTVSVRRDEAREVEKHAHWILRHKHSRGEWFSCGPDEAVAAINASIKSVRAGTAQEERALARGPRRHAKRPDGPGFLVGVRMQPDELALLDAMIAEGADPTISRPEGLRQVLRAWREIWASEPSPTNPQEEARRVSDAVRREIEEIERAESRRLGAIRRGFYD